MAAAAAAVPGLYEGPGTFAVSTAIPLYQPPLVAPTAIVLGELQSENQGALRASVTHVHLESAALEEARKRPGAGVALQAATQGLHDALRTSVDMEVWRVDHPNTRTRASICLRMT